MSDRPLRLLIALATAVLLLIGLAAGVWLTESLLSISHLLSPLEEQAAPSSWKLYLVLTLAGFYLTFAVWVMWRLLRPRRKPASPQPEQPADESSVAQKLDQARASGIDVSAPEQEFERLRQRRQAGKIRVALFGDISSGKSSLINALLPDSKAQTSAVGGTTQSITEYRWQSAAGDELILLDMPGLDEAGGAMDAEVQDEAVRAHVVIYLLEGDLTRTQAAQVQTLSALHKPMILALNKTDRLSDNERALIRQRLAERLHELGREDVPVVGISSGGTQSLIRIDAEGHEQQAERLLPPNLDELKAALQQLIDGNQDALEQLADTAAFTLVMRQLDLALAEKRREQAQKMIESYARKAVVTAMASVAPGTDLVLQGYLATQMLKDLAELYQVKLRQVEINLLLELVQKHVRTHITLVLGLAGNAAKAFPGIGTLAGGALHAIAYGLLFDALGKGVAESLATRGELHPIQAARQFEDKLSDDFQKAARRSAGFLAEYLAQGKKQD